MLTLENITEAIIALVDKYALKSVDLFGSYADGTATDESDIDLLVEFNTPYVSLFRISEMKIEISEKLDKEIDIIHSPIPSNSLLDIKKVIKIYEQ
ncbi:nucleotidyltransferase domain-containing protein [Acidaminobacter sp. JC074]|uniref:nucleotidyltransferase family protein n=1 Tax=Acidaminobacter sp. JC074 TaxID=2530199 RepID=UPI001F10EE0D|nr:nucleotidyltransferase domain-containing protein [Acidaminobacter sp. JC074]MCH4887031.1 nucleotidyltransferase domain-containing protein [Acidaminobacter sp. JC074]